MNILIAGAGGFLGSALVELLATKYSVFALVRNSAPLPAAKHNVTFIGADLSKLHLNELPNDIDVIYYLAHPARFREFPSGGPEMLDINITVPVRLAVWAIQNRVGKFFYASTGGVSERLPRPWGDFLLSGKRQDIAFYLDTKLSAELLLRGYAPFFTTLAILRPFFIYGPGQNETMLVRRLIRCVAEGKEISLNGVEGIKLNPVYVSDAAMAFANLLQLAAGQYMFNIAGNEIVSIKKLSDLIGAIIGRPPVFTYAEDKQADVVGDNSQMRENLHDPVVALRDGLDRVWNLHRNS